MFFLTDFHEDQNLQQEDSGPPVLSANRLEFDAEKGSEFFEFACDVSDSDGTMVGWAMAIPLLHESPGSDGEFVATVGVSDLQDGARNRFALGDEKFGASIGSFDHGEQGHGSVAHAHFDGKTAADLAMVDIERADFGFAGGDLDVTWAVVAE